MNEELTEIGTLECIGGPWDGERTVIEQGPSFRWPYFSRPTDGSTPEVTGYFTYTTYVMPGKFGFELVYRHTGDEAL